MQIVESEIARVIRAPNGPNYNVNNPVLRVMRAVERVDLAAPRETYLADSLQYLFPFRDLALYSPAGGEADNIDPRFQENKEDFQKQNIGDFHLADFHLARGYATAGDWTGPFLQISYRGSDTPLEEKAGGTLGERIQMWIRVGAHATPNLVQLPYNPATHRYEVELWGFPGADLWQRLEQDQGGTDTKAHRAIQAGRLVARPDLVRGSLADFQGPAFDAAREAGNRAQPNPEATLLWNRAPDHAMHPLRPLRIELAFADATATHWDSRDGQNHQVEFNMALRGWNSYLAVGVSPNPHGGVGFLEFRNLFSNYFGHENTRQASLGGLWQGELGRNLDWWNHDANTWNYGRPQGPKAGGPKQERFLAVEYMDLHILQPECGIGVHRHRDNQEVFLMLQGKGMMIVGDWCQHPARSRAMEVRTLLAGDLALCKTGQLHALYNSTDEPVQLFMFGGYD
jgi:mannose-6-phosphate isomerase-like protein (cupin superfamily)